MKSSIIFTHEHIIYDTTSQGIIFIITSIASKRAGHLSCTLLTMGASQITSCLLNANVLSILALIVSLLLRFLTSERSSTLIFSRDWAHSPSGKEGQYSTSPLFGFLTSKAGEHFSAGLYFKELTHTSGHPTFRSAVV